MLQFIHSRLSGIIAWVIIFVVGPGLVLWGVNYYVQRSSRTDVVAKVNGVKIYRNQLENIYEKYVKTVPREVLTDQVQLALKKQSLDMLVFHSVIQTMSKSLGIFVSEQQVNDIIASDPNFYVDNQFSNEKFQQFIRNSGFHSLRDFYEHAKLQIMMKQYEAGIMESEFITDHEYKQFADFVKQTRNIEYIRLPVNKLVNTKVPVSQEAIASYYKNNKDKFKEKEKISIKYIELKLDDVKNKISVTDHEIIDYYHQHKDNYVEANEWKIAHILLAFKQGDVKDKDAKHKEAQEIVKQLQQGKHFDSLAKKYSADQVSSQKGGTLPWLKENVIERNIVDALKKLPKPNTITPILETSKGYVIVKLLDVKKGKERTLSHLKNDIKNTLLDSKAQASYGEISEQLADLTYSSPDSLDEASRMLKLPIHETPLFEKGQKIKDGILKNNKIIDAIYHEEVYSQKNNSYPIQLDDNTVIVLRIHQIIPERVKTLAEIKEEIKTAILEEKAKTYQNTLSSDLIKKMRYKQPINQILATHGLKIEKLNNVSRDSKLDLKIVNLAFSMSLINSDESVKELMLDDGTLIIIQLNSINHPDLIKLTPNEQNKIRQLAKEYNNKILMSAYVENLKSKSSIKLYNDVIEDMV